jgi:hypothetical protein
MMIVSDAIWQFSFHVFGFPVKPVKSTPPNSTIPVNSHMSFWSRFVFFSPNCPAICKVTSLAAYLHSNHVYGCILYSIYKLEAVVQHGLHMVHWTLKNNIVPVEQLQPSKQHCLWFGPKGCCYSQVSLYFKWILLLCILLGIARASRVIVKCGFWAFVVREALNIFLTKYVTHCTHS